MSRIDKLERLKKRAEDIRQECDQAQGRMQETLKRLKEEFDVDSVEAAKKLQRETAIFDISIEYDPLSNQDKVSPHLFLLIVFVKLISKLIN